MLLLQVASQGDYAGFEVAHPPDVFTVRASVQQSFVGGTATDCSQPEAVLARYATVLQCVLSVAANSTRRGLCASSDL